MTQLLIIAALDGFLGGMVTGIVFEIRTGYFRRRWRL